MIVSMRPADATFKLKALDRSLEINFKRTRQVDLSLLNRYSKRCLDAAESPSSVLRQTAVRGLARIISFGQDRLKPERHSKVIESYLARLADRSESVRIHAIAGLDNMDLFRHCADTLSKRIFAGILTAGEFETLLGVFEIYCKLLEDTRTRSLQGFKDFEQTVDALTYKAYSILAQIGADGSATAAVSILSRLRSSEVSEAILNDICDIERNIRHTFTGSPAIIGEDITTEETLFLVRTRGIIEAIEPMLNICRMTSYLQMNGEIRRRMVQAVIGLGGPTPVFPDLESARKGWVVSPVELQSVIMH